MVAPSDLEQVVREILTSKKIKDPLTGKTGKDVFRRAKERDVIGQLFAIDEAFLIDVYSRFVPNVSASILMEETKTKLQAHEKTTINKLSKDELQLIESIRPIFKAASKGKPVYIVLNKRWAEEKYKLLITSIVDQHTKNYSPIALKVALSSINIEHGAGGGSAISAIRAREGIVEISEKLKEHGIDKAARDKLLNDLLSTEISAKVDEEIRTVTIKDFLKIDTQIVSIEQLNSFNAKYIIRLTAGNILSNNLESKFEAKFAEAVREAAVTKIFGSKGLFPASVSIEEMTLTALTANNPSLKVKKPRKSRKSINVKSSQTTNYEIKQQVSGLVQNYKKGSIQAPSAPRRIMAAEQPSSLPLNIINLLNAKLSQEIRKRMTYPRLVYRTGRFASSVKVTRSTTDSLGNPTLSYTYDKNPYQIFETGKGSLPWATPARDPRTIIENSIREIAIGVIAGKFNLRRE